MSPITLLGVTNFRDSDKKFGIKLDDRRRHMYLLGKTGMGKSTILENMIIQDIINGNGVAVIDPHGELVEKVIQFVPNHRINDVIYFNPSDMEYPIAFNVLEKVDPAKRHLVAAGLIGVFKKIWAESWGPRLEYILRNAILALLDYPESTLLGVTRMLSDKVYRTRVVAKIEDPIVKAFWTDEFAKYTDKFASEAISPIQNKVGQFLSVTLIRNVVGQVKSAFDIRDAMDNKKILLMNLSKGRTGEDNPAMIGAMLITKIYLSAMSRVDMPEEDRSDFYLYVDEFQNFATESFADILSEARKYRLCLTMAHQYIAQLEEKVADAVFGNVGSIVSFRVGATDAEFLEKEFEPIFMQPDFLNLPKYNYYLRLMIDGVASDPFSATGLPPMPKAFMSGNLEKIIKVSRERYACPKAIVEDRIMRWSQTGRPEPKVAEEDKEFSADCVHCKTNVKLAFEPDGVRPVFCKDCLKLYRQGLIKAPPRRKIPVPGKEVKPLEKDSSLENVDLLEKISPSEQEKIEVSSKVEVKGKIEPSVKSNLPKRVENHNIKPDLKNTNLKSSIKEISLNDLSSNPQNKVHNKVNNTFKRSVQKNNHISVKNDSSERYKSQKDIRRSTNNIDRDKLNKDISKGTSVIKFAPDEISLAEAFSGNKIVGRKPSKKLNIQTVNKSITKQDVKVSPMTSHGKTSENENSKNDLKPGQVIKF